MKACRRTQWGLGNEAQRMENKKGFRLELVPARLIKRMPGLNLGASRKGLGKAIDISRKRGYYRPVVLSEAQGRMTLISGAAAFEACLEDNAAKVPAVIVRTEGEADDLMFALQSAQLDDPPNAIGVSAAIVRLVDSHGVPRKHIAEALGKSPAWINRMEKLSRDLNDTVQKLVAEGKVAPRSAQEIARLPGGVQAPFAVSATNEFLGKEDVAYLVGRYLDEDAGAEERDRIVRTPKLALPDRRGKRGRAARDNSDSARLSRAIAICLDDAVRLCGLLGRIDIDGAAVRMSDAMALADSLAGLAQKLRAIFAPGKNKGGMADDRF
jgi:ParB-like chromosome segregation protein Spo0J